MEHDLLDLLRAVEPAEELLAVSLREADCPQVMESIACELLQAKNDLARAQRKLLHATGRVEEWLQAVLCHEGTPRAFERAYYALALARRDLRDEVGGTDRREPPLWPAGVGEDKEEEALSLWHSGYFDGERRRQGARRPGR